MSGVYWGTSRGLHIQGPEGGIGASGGIGTCRRCRGLLGGVRVYWRLAGTVGTQGYKEYRWHKGAFGAPGGRGVGAIREASGV